MSKKLAEACRPNWTYHHIREIPFDRLAAEGITNFIIDVDNTLLPTKSDEISEEVVKFLKDARDSGHITGIVLVSNVGIFNMRADARVNNVKEKVGADYAICCYWPWIKPHPRPFTAALAILDSEPKTTAVIGDQYFTDMLGANRLGITSIKVEPIGADRWITKLKRRREAQLLKYYGIE